MTNLKKSIQNITEKKCTPCQGGIPSLPLSQTTKFLSELGNNWDINEKGYLIKKFTFNDFIKAMNFANKITNLSEDEGHHPELRIGWGYCVVVLWTHKINGLTENDFILAAKIEKLR